MTAKVMKWDPNHSNLCLWPFLGDRLLHTYVAFYKK